MDFVISASAEYQCNCSNVQYIAFNYTLELICLTNQSKIPILCEALTRNFTFDWDQRLIGQTKELADHRMRLRHRQRRMRGIHIIA